MTTSAEPLNAPATCSDIAGANVAARKAPNA